MSYTTGYICKIPASEIIKEFKTYTVVIIRFALSPVSVSDRVIINPIPYSALVYTIQTNPCTNIAIHMGSNNS